MQSILSDIQYGFRSLRRNRMFAVLVVLTLGLGIGANTAVFSVVSAAILQPLPLTNPEQIVIVWRTAPKAGLPRAPVSAPDFEDVCNQNDVFIDACLLYPAEVSMAGRGEPEHLFGMYVSPNFFQVTTARAELGREISKGYNPANGLEVVVSYSFWQRRLGGNPDAVGEALNLDSRRYTIAGVMPPQFQFPPFFNLQEGGVVPRPIDIWLPIDLKTSELDGFEISDRRSALFCVLARLKQDVDVRQAQANLDTIAARLEAQYPDTDKNLGFVVLTALDQLVGNFHLALKVLMLAVGFVLLISCANAANLMLSRSAARENEFAIRSAMGAGRWRIVRQLMIESFILTLAAAGLGILLAYLGNRTLGATIPTTVSLAKQIDLDGRVLGFTLLIAVITAFLFGLAPAVQASKPNLDTSLKQNSRGIAGGRRQRGLRNALAVIEIGLATALLASASLFAQSFLKTERIDPGYLPQNLLTMRINLDRSRYPEAASQVQVFKRLLEQVSSVPAIEEMGAIDALPFSQDYVAYSFDVEGRPLPFTERPLASAHTVSVDFFKTMSIVLVEGRLFDEHDARDDPKLAIINETMARLHFADTTPIGKRIKFEAEPAVWRQIIGVVRDVKFERLDAESGADVYVLYPQAQPDLANDRMTLVLRTTANRSEIYSVVRRELDSIDGDVPIYEIKMMEDYFASALSKRRFSVLVLSSFAALALLLAAIGVYGVVSYSLSRRAKEIGIRMALGATRSKILILVMTQTLVLTVTGIVAGCAIALAMTKTFESLLYGVGSNDLRTYITISATLLLASVVAGYIPARRAIKIDPVQLLRWE
jgi:putative ABC transport system permease protein